MPNAYILVESVLNTLEALTSRTAREFEGTIRFSVGDSHCLTFAEAAGSIAAAERLSADWEAESRREAFDCPINIALHRGRICAFRSFLYGEGLLIAGRLQAASVQVLADREGGVFLTNSVHDDLVTTPWQSRLQPVTVELRGGQYSGIKVYRLSGVT